MNPFEQSLIVGAALIVLSVVTSKASSRLGVPVLLLFLVIGMLASVHGLGAITFTDYDLAHEVGIFALAFILFSGGIDTDAKAARSVLRPALALSTFGVLIAAGLVCLFSKLLLGFSWLEGLLLGATIASTDVAAVFAVLRSREVGLRGAISPLLELESALNDPMAVFLGIALLALVGGKDQSILPLLPLFFQQMIFALVVGWISGKSAVQLINRIKLEYEGLYPVLSLGWVLLTYGLTQAISGSGFLAVYISGIIIGNSNLLHRKSLTRFHEGVAWLGQIGMFLLMGLLVNPKDIWAVAPLGIALSLFLVFVARPVSVLLCLPGRRFTIAEKLMVSWAGLRGAVPIILASYVLATHISRATEIFNLVFFVTFLSVLLQGTTISKVAKWLRVDSPFREKFRFPIEFTPHENLKNKLIEVTMTIGQRAVGMTLVELNLPSDVLILLIQRGDEVLVPRGGTHLMEGDRLLTLVERSSAEDIQKLLT